MKPYPKNCIDLVCTGTAQALALENKSQLIPITIAGLDPSDTLVVPLKELPLWRFAKLVYVSITGVDANTISLQLDISGITQGGPWLGGELAPTNANACAIFNCAEGYCIGPVEVAQLIVKNLAGAVVPAGAAMVVRVTYEYPCQDSSVPDSECGCGNGGGSGGGGNTPQWNPGGSDPTTVPVDPTTGQPVAVSLGEIVKGDDGSLWLPDPQNPRRLCRVSWDVGSCRTIVIPSRQSDGTYKPVGGISCKQKCT